MRQRPFISVIFSESMRPARIIDARHKIVSVEQVAVVPDRLVHARAPADSPLSSMSVRYVSRFPFSPRTMAPISSRVSAHRDVVPTGEFVNVAVQMLRREFVVDTLLRTPHRGTERLHAVDMGLLADVFSGTVADHLMTGKSRVRGSFVAVNYRAFVNV